MIILTELSKLKEIDSSTICYNGLKRPIIDCIVLYHSGDYEGGLNFQSLKNEESELVMNHGTTLWRHFMAAIYLQRLYLFPRMFTISNCKNSIPSRSLPSLFVSAVAFHLILITTNKEILREKKLIIGERLISGFLEFEFG
ncbi:hypothetical protein DERP_000527 [Dermatophagoides pteronyssinus]|uniref:Uncharacterized protein n=1 Tax=Dermatophagoides pteronyssinus TaxID=6956 RepID=A0ABQ8J0F0_DERPT|nr:hypothetical protein DERP_000527 [Dermatophagoides pteronyssinus]